MNFLRFKTAVARQFERLEHDCDRLFRADVSGSDLWEAYLAAFPPGTNSIFRTRAEYDCSCCRQFIKAIGNVVAIIDGQVESLWDIKCDEPTYQTVADALATLVKSRPIADLFRHTERTAGTDKNFEHLVENGPRTWNHFFVNIPPRFVCSGVEIGLQLSEARATHDVLKRSLEELTTESVDTVLELIAQGSLYRGNEHRSTLKIFQRLKRDYEGLPQRFEERDVFVWSILNSVDGAVARIRNT